MKDIKTLKTEEVEKMLADSRGEVRDFQFNLSGAKIKNVRAGRNVKRNIARILTELRGRKS